MRRSPGPRETAELSKSLNHRLNKYALAAAAAGLGMLAPAQSAEGKIVYTAAHAIIGKPFPLDLNHDGIVDLDLLHASHNYPVRSLLACQFNRTYSGEPVCAFPSSTNSVRSAVSMGRVFGAALRKGAKIGHHDGFRRGPSAILGGLCCFTLSSTRWYGPWVNGGKGVKNRYLGVKFNIKGRFHFGWARLTVKTTKNDFTAILTGYAYETVPGKAIVAGKTKGPDAEKQPATLGRLALGRK